MNITEDSKQKFKINSSFLGVAVFFVLSVFTAFAFVLGNLNNTSLTLKSKAAELALNTSPTPTPYQCNNYWNPPDNEITCPIFPADNVWNRSINDLPLHSQSAGYISTLQNLAPNYSPGYVEFGFFSGTYQGLYGGMPYMVVPQSQTNVPINFTAYGSSSDPGPYPYPTNTAVQGGSNSTGDRHALVLQNGSCKLYESYSAYPNSDGSWNIKQGSVWDLNSNLYRPSSQHPNGWPNGTTSADASGLPVLPGLLRYDEVYAAVHNNTPIRHAIRFATDPHALQHSGYIWPAIHGEDQGTGGTNTLPLGLRLRLKNSFVINSNFLPEVKVILQAMKDYGVMLVDGSPDNAIIIGGTPDCRWPSPGTMNSQINTVHPSDFEVVDQSGIMVNPDSMQVSLPGTTPAPSPSVTTIPVPTLPATPTIAPTATNTPAPTVTNAPTATPTVTVIPTPTPTIGYSSAFLGIYYNDVKVGNTRPHLTNEVMRRYDNEINFNWGYGSPASVVTVDHFSAQWEKQDYFTAGTHTFTLSHDDGLRVYLDNNLVYNYWYNQSASTRRFNVSIPSTGYHDIIVQYYENSGNASVNVSWQ